MNKLLICSLFVIILSSFFVVAEPFDVLLTAKDATIEKNETAFYYLTLTNNRGTDTFLVSFPSGDWIARTVPLSDYHFPLGLDEKKTVLISIQPKPYLTTGPYAVPINVKRQSSGGIERLTMPVQISQPERREYLPVVRFDIDMAYENDPRQNAFVSLDIENLNFRNITELSIKLESSIFTDERTIAIGPRKDKVENFEFELDNLQKPTTDKLKVTLSVVADNKTYSWDKSAEYKILEYSNLKKNPRKESGFLKTTEFIDIENEGNTEKTFEITHKIGYVKSFFIKESPTASILKSQEGRFLVWSVKLGPMETRSIEIVTSYRYLATFIVAILIAVILYYTYRPPIVIKKEVSHIGTSEGGISDIKVILYIKNRTGSIIEDISIIEKIPHIANIGKDFQVGTIKPTKIIQNPKKGTLVKWELQSLEAFEERIITYKIKSKLSILGGLTLPATIIKYIKKGKSGKTRSNRLVLEI